MAFKIEVEGKTYDKFKIYDVKSNCETKLCIEPFKEKLFNLDIFDKDDEVIIVQSSIRTKGYLCGVLVLSGNKTFGTYKSKPLYKCIPNDKLIPPFLIPYKIKTNFNKMLLNKYVLFKFDSWINKHPLGVLVNVIGNVDKLCYFYEYELYCKNLNFSIKNFTNFVNEKVRNLNEEEFVNNILLKNPSIKNLTEKNNIITIDPENSVDFDDAVSIDIINNNEFKIAIYIANVAIWLDSLNVLNEFSERISTIYLPDRKLPMLPVKLSDNLCSLIENKSRLTFVCELTVKNNLVVSVKFYNSLIRVKKNFVYESDSLKKYSDYKNLIKKVKLMNSTTNFISDIKDSHEVIAYLMVAMNYYTSKNFIENKNGIFRKAQLKESDFLNDLPAPVHDFMKIWNSSGGEYVLFGNTTNHDILKLDSYSHITSPIRRIIDLLNIIIIQKNLNLIESNEILDKFLNSWLKKIDYINKIMKSIRRVQNDSSILTLLHNNPSITDNDYEGYIFDISKNNEFYYYMVYIPHFKLISKFKDKIQFKKFIKYKFKIVMFLDEDNLKKKIRLQKI